MECLRFELHCGTEVAYKDAEFVYQAMQRQASYPYCSVESKAEPFMSMARSVERDSEVRRSNILKMFLEIILSPFQSDSN